MRTLQRSAALTAAILLLLGGAVSSLAQVTVQCDQSPQADPVFCDLVCEACFNDCAADCLFCAPYICMWDFNRCINACRSAAADSVASSAAKTDDLRRLELALFGPEDPQGAFCGA